MRSFLSILALWFFGGYIITYGKEAVNQTYNNIVASFYSTPTIIYSGDKIDLGTGNLFELSFTSKKADTISVNGNTLTSDNDNYYYSGTTANLQTGMSIEIIASNKYKSSQKQVAIVRNLTQTEEEELQMRIAKEKEEREAELVKLREEEIARQKQSEKYEKEKQALQAKYERIVKNVYLYEAKAKLYDLGFTALGDAEYERAPDGTSQLANYYIKHENGYSITVKLQYADVSGRHFARVTVN